MLSKPFRLRKKSEFNRVLKYGKTKNESQFSLKFLDNNLGISRFGFLASKRLFPRAVQRNLIKRRFRETIRQLLDEIDKGKDIILIIKSGERTNFLQRKESLTSLFKKANLIKEHHV
jgi:ribonuclease P protein component